MNHFQGSRDPPKKKPSPRWLASWEGRGIHHTQGIQIQENLDSARSKDTFPCIDPEKLDLLLVPAVALDLKRQGGKLPRYPER